MNGLMAHLIIGVNGLIVFIPAFTDVLIIILGVLVDVFTFI